MIKMRKVLSLITFVISPPITITCFYFTTSCAVVVDDPDYQSEHADFINQRTFSIYSSEGVVGTSWIFEKSQASDYSYYLATNVHVASHFSRNIPIKMYLAYNPDYSNRTWMNGIDYFPIDDYSLLGSTVDTRPTKPEWNSLYPNYEWDVDFDVFKINFGTVLQIQAKDPFRTSKNNLINRLDNLNAYASEHNNQIVQFASSDYQYKRGMAIHVAGFPVRPYGSTSEIPRWTSYQTVYSNSDFSYDTSSNSNNWIFSKDQKIYFADNKPINVIGKVLNYKPNGTPELTGGSSGSMVVDDNDIVIAIHFAGSIQEDDEYTSILGAGLFLNTNNSYFGTSYNYEVLSDWFTDLVQK